MPARPGRSRCSFTAFCAMKTARWLETSLRSCWNARGIARNSRICSPPSRAPPVCRRARWWGSPIGPTPRANALASSDCTLGTRWPLMASGEAWIPLGGRRRWTPPIWRWRRRACWGWRRRCRSLRFAWWRRVTDPLYGFDRAARDDTPRRASRPAAGVRRTSWRSALGTRSILSILTVTRVVYRQRGPARR